MAIYGTAIGGSGGGGKLNVFTGASATPPADKAEGVYVQMVETPKFIQVGCKFRKAGEEWVPVANPNTTLWTYEIMTHVSDGMIYLMNQNKMYQIDLETMTETLLYTSVAGPSTSTTGYRYSFIRKYKDEIHVLWSLVFSGSYYSRLEVYNLTTGEVTSSINSTNTFGGYRSGAAVASYNNIVMVAFGIAYSSSGASSSSSFLKINFYDMETKTSTTYEVTESYVRLKAAFYLNGLWHLVGGVSNAGEASALTARHEVYDMETGTISLLNAAPVNSIQCAGISLDEDTALVWQRGGDVYQYNSLSDSFVKVATLNTYVNLTELNNNRGIPQFSKVGNMVYFTVPSYQNRPTIETYLIADSLTDQSGNELPSDTLALSVGIGLSNDAGLISSKKSSVSVPILYANLWKNNTLQELPFHTKIFGGEWVFHDN